MTTDYKNLSLFEIGAVCMIAVGIALVGFQVFMALPDTAQARVANAFQIFEMNDAAMEVWHFETRVNQIVFNGTQDLTENVMLAIGELAMPVADDMAQVGDNFAAIANALTSVSDNIALNYQNNYAAPGVEAGMGGKVMGAYLERLVD